MTYATNTPKLQSPVNVIHSLEYIPFRQIDVLILAYLQCLPLITVHQLPELLIPPCSCAVEDE